MADRLNWERDGRAWPNRDVSRFILAAGLRWHVQQMGRGPVLLLIHGTGASTHSWRELMPLLAARFTVIAPDLPGHAFTDTPADARRLSLPGMAASLRALVDVLGVQIDSVVGHSAGAAIAARICLDGGWAPRGLVSLNGAFLPLGGLPGVLFPPVARLMAATPLASRLFAWRAADRAAVERLIAGTGSTLDAAGTALYGQLVRNPAHVAGALSMMANWDLQPLQRELPRLNTPLHLIVASRDRAVPPSLGRQVAAMVPGASLTELPNLGHLAHEERPAEMAQRLLALLAA